MTSTAFYTTLVLELRQTLDASTELERCLEGLCGSKAPSLARFKDALLQAQHLVDTFLHERGVSVGTAPIPDDASSSFEFSRPEEGLSTELVTTGGPIRSRAEAYRRLAEAADYLLRTEPHSPTPYLVKRAVTWGSMSLTDLLHEFVQNSTDLKAIYTLLGIKDTA